MDVCPRCMGIKRIHEYARTYPCPACGGTGSRVDAERIAREQEVEQKRRAEEFAAAVAELRALREKEQGR